MGGGVLVAVLPAFAAAAFRRPPTGPTGLPLPLRSGAIIARGVVLTYR
ncbi:hypothetical protein [Streptomyces sp. NPDC001070]